MQLRAALYLTIAAGLASVSVPALSQVTGVVTNSTGSATIKRLVGTNIVDFSVDAPDIGYEAGNLTSGGATTFAATSDLGVDSITFRNGNAASGLYALVTTHTVIEVTFKNDGATAVVPTLSSTILPAGMGLFTSASGCLNALTTCGPSDINTATFQDFTASNIAGSGNVLAGASFDFKITGSGQEIYDLSGGFQLVNQGGTNTLVTDLSDAAAALTGFGVTSSPSSQSEYGVSWDATHIDVAFADGALLQPGDSTTLVYETTVTSFVAASCITNPTSACLIAYSAFGDPIGRGGGTDPSLFLRLGDFVSKLSDPALIRSFTPSEDDLLGITPTAIPTPVFKDGVLYLDGVPSVPEPATWGLMISGFALLGVALRRKPAAHPVRVR